MRLCSTVCLLLLWTLPGQATETLHIDARRSEASFSARLFWFRHVEGRMAEPQGQLQIDDNGKARVTVRLDIASARMDNPRREAMLRSPEFFDSARYPLIRFQSGQFPVSSLWQGGTIDGQLSMRGATHAVQFTLQPLRCDRQHISECLIRADGEVKRSAFGMDTYRLALGDDVKLSLTIGFRR